MIKELAKKNRSYRRFYENKKITIPRTTRTIPVALFKVLGVALFANKAAILAQIRVKIIHKIHTVKFCYPGIQLPDFSVYNSCFILKYQRIICLSCLCL